MEAILFAGIQGVGKSTFYAARFADSHVRINLDMLKTRHRERILLCACLQAGQPFVADNTNLTAADRARYIGPARAAGFLVVGYYFQSRVQEAIERNRRRPTPVPDHAIAASSRRLELPRRDEGFERLLYVSLTPGGDFTVQDWVDEL
jgi:predicted kinase